MLSYNSVYHSRVSHDSLSPPNPQKLLGIILHKHLKLPQKPKSLDSMSVYIAIILHKHFKLPQKPNTFEFHACIYIDVKHYIRILEVAKWKSKQKTNRPESRKAKWAKMSIISRIKKRWQKTVQLNCENKAHLQCQWELIISKRNLR